MDTRVRFAGGRVAVGARSAVRADIVTRRGRVLGLSNDGWSETRDGGDVNAEGYLIVPALVNAHDHLEFNLFPRLGHGPYRNATEWANDIYQPNETPVREHTLIPKPMRYLWGALKNLVSGVGTVAHHNGYERRLGPKFPVRVVRRYGWAHSLAFSTDIAERYSKTPRRWPFILHAAEGTDDAAEIEIEKLWELGVISSRTVLVHAVRVGAEAVEKLRRAKAAVVLCPTSNLFTLGKAPPTELLRSGLTCGLGSDSALTAAGDLLDECRAAQELWGLQDQELYESVTTTNARILRLHNGAGAITSGGVADFLLVRDEGQEPAAVLPEPRVEAVFVRGKARVATQRFMEQNEHLRDQCGYWVEVEGRGSFLTSLPVRRMYKRTAAFIGKDVRLAGRKVRV